MKSIDLISQKPLKSTRGVQGRVYFRAYYVLSLIFTHSMLKIILFILINASAMFVAWPKYSSLGDPFKKLAPLLLTDFPNGTDYRKQGTLLQYSFLYFSSVRKSGLSCKTKIRQNAESSRRILLQRNRET
jgi:hypothetical protein